MNRTMLLTLAGTILALATPRAHALSKADGALLSRTCKAALQIDEHPTPRVLVSKDQDAAASGCRAYVEGVLDTAEGWKLGRAAPFCITAGTPRSVLLHVIVQFIDTNPRVLSENGAVVIREALQHSYPCPAR